ncbi:MAG: 16S rRNA (guanine(527)-N(7))-methyltransferase RsmG [bacterium]
MERLGFSERIRRLSELCIEKDLGTIMNPRSIKNTSRSASKDIKRRKAKIHLPDRGKSSPDREKSSSAREKSLPVREKLPSSRDRLPPGPAREEFPPAREKLPPGPASLKEWFQRSNLPLIEKQYKQLWQYHNLLREKNEEYDLTRILQFDDMVQKHYIDSILVARILNWDLPSPLLDIGTGAGLPAIPLKIACPETEFILSEGRHKRVRFLHEVIEALGLQKIEIYGHKTSTSFNRPIRGVITRAVEPIAETLARVRRSLQTGGWAIFMKGPRCDAEIEEAVERMGRSYRLDRDVAYTIPHTPHQRRLVIFERIEEQWETEHGYQVQSIESPANETFKHLKALLTSKGIKKEGHALVFGRKIVREVMRDFPDLCAGLILSPTREEEVADIVSEALPGGIKQIPLYRLSSPLYRELDIFGTGADILVVRTPPIETWQAEDALLDKEAWQAKEGRQDIDVRQAEEGRQDKEARQAEEKRPGCTMMIPFQDPENTGAVIRSAAAFGVRDIILLKEAASPYHPKSIRAGGSAVFRVNYYKGPSIQEIQSIVQAAQGRGIPLITLSMEGTRISRFQFPESFILLPGTEGPGLPEELRSQALAIPMEPGLESLNAATAAAIALYEWRRRIGKE